MAPARGRIVADDFTGAADAAAPFARLGWETVVALRPDAASPAVLAVTTESRALTGPDAAAAVRACCEALGPPVPGVLPFQKIDSVLRGNPRAEVEAALAGWGLSRALVAPAFPAQGRTTVGGVQLDGGRPVREASAGTGAETSDLRRLFAGLPCTVVDAASDADLDGLVARELGGRAGTLWVGTGGLAAALARRLAAPAPRAPVGGPLPGVDGRPAAGGRSGNSTGVLAVCGSAHPVARGQAEALVRRCGALAWTVDGGGTAPEPAGTLAAALVGGRDVLLRLPADQRLADERLAAAALARLAAAVLRGIAARVPLVLTGGDTAAAVLRALDAAGLLLTGELDAGIPLGAVRPGGRPVVTKSGGFGAADTLVRAVRHLRGVGVGA